MPKRLSYKLSISYKEEIGFTLNSVVLAPRQSAPLDLAAAAKNLRVDFHGQNEDEIAIISRKIVKYLLTDFFVLAHRTGLYNRQLKLWESLASVSDVKIAQIRHGFFKRVKLPIWELLMVDDKGRAKLLVRLAFDASNSEFDLSTERSCKEMIVSTVQRAERLKAENPLFSGVFLFCPRQAGDSVRSYLSIVTAVDDPVGKYESRLVSLPEVSIDLFDYDDGLDEFKLLHPNLHRSNPG